MNIIRFFITFSGMLLLSVLASAQSNEILGSIVDAADNAGIAGALVRVAPANDTTHRQGTVTGVDGQFLLKVTGNGSYDLIVSSIGHQTIHRIIYLQGGRTNVGTIKLTSSAISLKGVTVSGQQIRASQNGDTSSFKADAYKVNMDASAEDLVKKMPGITSDNNGLKANGEDVKKVLVDGKPFFGDDPNAALKNLPAEIIDRVEIFDNQSDQARFTGFNDGNQVRTMNFVTKNGKNGGVFGKLYAGYGTSNRYQGSITLNYFNGVRRISLLGLTNNINQQNFSIADVLSVIGNSGISGGPGGPGRGTNNTNSGTKPTPTSFGGPGGLLTSQQSGITQTSALGLNFSDEWGQKIKVTGSYFFNATDNNNESQLLRHYFTDTSLLYRKTSNTQTRNVNHRASLQLEYAINETNAIIITPRITFQKNRYSTVLNSLTQQDNQTLNGTATEQSAITSGYSFTNNILFQHKFGKPGRTISLNLGQQLSSGNGDGAYYSDSHYGTDSSHSVLDQHYINISQGRTFSGTISYTEPAGRNGQLLVNYNLSHTGGSSDRETANLDTFTARYDDLDTMLSSSYSSTYATQRGGIGYRYGNKPLDVSIGLDVQEAVLNGEQVFPAMFSTSRSFLSILPSATLNYRFSKSKNLNINYRSSSTAPTITQLQSVLDVSNPLQLTTGNAWLKQTDEHQLLFRYSAVNKNTARSFFLFGMCNYTANYISNATVIASADTLIEGGYLLNAGSQLTTPVNLDNYYSLRTNAVYSLPVTSLKSNLNINAGVNYIHTPALIDNMLNYSNNVTVNGGAYLGSNISQNIDFSVSYNGSYNLVRNTINASYDNSYYSGNAMLRANATLARRIVLNTDITHTLYSGLSQSFNQSFMLWNAYVGYKLLKDRSLEMKISVFDILNQNQSVSRSVTEIYIQDEKTNALQRHGMITLTYTLRKFKNGSSEPQSKLPGDMPPGPPPGSPGMMGPPPGGN